MQFHADFGGRQRLEAFLTRAATEFRLALFVATTKAVEIQKRAIRADEPTLTGRLRGSTDSKVEPTPEGAEGIVFSTANYAPFVERGTRQHGRARRMFQRGVESTREPVKALFRSSVASVRF